MLSMRLLRSSSKGNCHLLATTKGGGSQLLLDAGMTYREFRQEMISVTELAGCLVTHEHKDHSKGVTHLLSKAVDCYMTEDTINNLGITSHRAKVIEPLKKTSVGPFTFMAVPVKHDVPNVAFYVTDGDETMGYITDCPYCKYVMKRPLSILAIECNYIPAILADNLDHEAQVIRVLRTHMGLSTLVDMLGKMDTSKLREVFLLHLSARHSDAVEMVAAVREVVNNPTVNVIVAEE